MSEPKESKASRALKAKVSSKRGALRRTARLLGKSAGLVSEWANAKRQPNADGVGLCQSILKIPAPWWGMP